MKKQRWDESKKRQRQEEERRLGKRKCQKKLANKITLQCTRLHYTTLLLLVQVHRECEYIR